MPLGAVIQLPQGPTEGILLQAPDCEVPETGSLSFLAAVPALQSLCRITGSHGLWSYLDSFLPLPSNDLGQVNLTSLCLSVFICKMGIIAVPASKRFFFFVSIQFFFFF